ncbi:hypothetical protein FACS1894170_12130 [Planctomycetales bacterium]|nr:hypothetical protein FACS1894170_12130 [Planctomycetales bacterium]
MYRLLYLAAVLIAASAAVNAQMPNDSFSSNDVVAIENASTAINAADDDPFLVQPHSVNPPPMVIDQIDNVSPLPNHTAAGSFTANALDNDRIRQLAMQTPSNAGAKNAEYLKPLNPWNGPFQNRQKKKDLEQSIIQQVGYASAQPPINNEPQFDWEKDEEKGFDWSILDPANFIEKMRDWVGLGPDENKAKAAMEKGRSVLLSNADLKDKKKNLEAAKHFSEAAKRFPDSVLEEDALHLAGECYYFADDYPKAMHKYQKLLITYQHSKHIDNDVRRLFKIARFWEAESKRRAAAALNFSDKSLPTYDTFGFAKKCYETIFINDPNGPISDDAVMALATAYMERGKYQGDDNYNQAAYYYAYLRENFPLSPHLAKASENELHARTRAYMGAEHPSKSLEEAGKLADITLRQFGSELDTEAKNEIVGMKENVLTRKAEQSWMMGQFYDIKKKRYGSAKLYYERIIEEYPQTEFAEKARRRMEVIKDLPEVPPIISLPFMSSLKK